MKISKFFSNDSDYGFIKNIDKYKIKYSKNLGNEFFDWDITSDHLNAKNHCAAVTSTNVDRYFCNISKCDELNFSVSSNDYSLEQVSNFDEHYDLIGNGPILTFAKKTKKILAEKGINVRYKTKWINKLPFIMESIDNNHLVAILLGSNFKDYHWILCTGYLITSENKIILKIIDNWNKNFRYYIPGDSTVMIYTMRFEKINNLNAKCPH